MSLSLCRGAGRRGHSGAGRLNSCRDGNGGRGSLAGGTGQRDLPVVGLDQAAGAGEAKAGPPAGGLLGEERIERVLESPWRHSYSPVLDDYQESAIRGCGLNADVNRLITRRLDR